MGKMLRYLRPYWRAVLAIMIMVTIAALGQLLLPDFMSRMIGEGITPVYEVYDETLGSFVSTDYCDTELGEDVCRIVGQDSNFDIILKYGMLMLAATLLSSASWIGLVYYSSSVSAKVGRDIRRDLYRKINDFSMVEAEKFGTSTLITRSTNDVVQIQNYLIMLLRMILRVPIIFVGALILSWDKSRELTSVLFWGIPALVALIVIVFIIVLPLFRALQKKIDKLTLVTRESINGVRVIRAFDKGNREVRRFKDSNQDMTNTTLKAGKVLSVMNPAVNLIFNIVILAVIYAAFRLISNHTSTNYQELANVSAVMQYSFQILFSLLMITFTFIMYPRSQVSSKRILEVLEQEISIKDTADSTYDDHDFTGVIEFDDVCFKYQDAEKNVLDNISFTARPGEVLAIIGSTGSGKSTLINLLPRFFDVTCGSIKIDDIDIRDLRMKKLRSLIGFVPQIATLFSGSIKENIAYGKPDASEAEIVAAANIAQASDFIEDLEEKYEARVDQGAVNFSGGQKQRLSIARAIIRKPLIYVFDDSFSALDFKTDLSLRQALKKEITKSTVLIVAQRIGTIMDADQIIVLQDGRIVGKGKHKELLESCDVYREIAYSQLSEAELA